MKTCALLTCKDLDDHLIDESCLENALTDAGWQYQWVQWKDLNIDWDQFDCAIIRTTWDYTTEVSFFLNQLEKIEKSSCRLFNSYELIQWNCNKNYLEKLGSLGVSIIPTYWATFSDVEVLFTGAKELKVEKIVIKPCVGAGSKNTFCIHRDEFNSSSTQLQCLVGMDVMIQEFMETIVTEGEYSAHFFNNDFSHIVLKKPKEGDFRSQEEFGSYIRRLDLTESQKVFCQEVLEPIPKGWLYARVDFINNNQGVPHLIELELIEPSLYFRYDESAGARMVTALNQLMLKAAASMSSRGLFDSRN